MPKKIIPLISGEKYHIFNRGVDKREVFSHKNDFLRFYMSLDIFNTTEPTHNFDAAKNKSKLNIDRLVRIYAYSLLPNHFHIILEQLVQDGISEFMKRLQGGYTLYFNEKYNRSGSLYQGTFKRIHIKSEEYFQYLFAYVNENHFVHNLTREDEIYFSSSLHYQNIVKSKILPDLETEYNFKENLKLAQMIKDKREIVQTEK